MKDRGSTPDVPLTLSELLDERAERRPDARALSFRRFVRGRAAEEVLTYGELARRARTLGRWLRRRAAPGDRALLVYPPSLGFVTAFFACLRAGIVAVPSSPPRLGSEDARLETIARDCGARWVLTTRALGSRVAQWQADSSATGSLEVLVTEPMDNHGPEPDEDETALPSSDATALLQYTSGSTSAPRGVELCQRSLLRNLELCTVSTGLGPGSSVVSWLPMFHDMGLVYGVLAPIYAGVPGLLMAPVDFVKRPLRWVRAVSDDRGTHTTGPNFALDLCTRKASTRGGDVMDLRQVAFFNCGAEPIRSRTLAEFARTFGRWGLPPESLCGGYGLAEYTLVVSVTPTGREPTLLAVDRSALARGRVVEVGTYRPSDPDLPDDHDPEVTILVGCGGGVLDTRIVIVDPGRRRPVEPARVGEIWVSGESAATGYWGKPGETERTFRATLPGDRRAYLRTGDLGFLHDGEVFIAGRLKELIIVDGRNLYPQDLEAAAQLSHAAIEPHRSAAFSVDQGSGEVLVLACEVARGYGRSRPAPAPSPDAVVAAVRERLAHDHGIRPHDVVLLGPGRLPRTTSGKIRRGECRRAYLAGTLERFGG